VKKILFVLALLVVVMPVLCYGLSGNAPEKSGKASYPYLIDNFADGNYNKDPEWFVFDKIVPTVVSNSTLDKTTESIGEYSLNLKGDTTSWYVGGIGTMLGIDATRYDSLELNVYGYGANSGLVKIEFYDDDNGNADIEVDKNWKTTADDLWSYELPVNWKGWKHISVPFSTFKVSGGGDKIWNPDLKNGSSGLNKVQIIAVANAEKGSVKFNLDTIELGVSK